MLREGPVTLRTSRALTKEGQPVEMAQPISQTVLLAPVPLVLLLDLAADAKYVAFGSRAAMPDEKYLELPVYIYASSTELKAPHPLAGRVAWCGTFAKITMADHTGKHPYPELRPKMAVANDTASHWFWEVDRFEKLKASLPLASFRTGKGPIKEAPRSWLIAEYWV